VPEVLGRTDLDQVLRTNTRLRTRIVNVATELDIDPGMLAASLFAEKGASAWSGTAEPSPQRHSDSTTGSGRTSSHV